jgi:hypothetical protein
MTSPSWPRDLVVNADRHNRKILSLKMAGRILGTVLFAVVVAVWLIWGPIGPICYVGGLFNSMVVWVLMLYLSLLMLPASVLFLVLVVYVPVTWHHQSSRAKRSLILWILGIGGLVGPTVVGFTGLTTSPFDLYVRGFATYVEHRADLGAIRAWLNQQDPKMLIDKYAVVMQKDLTGPEQPSAIADLHPKRAVIWSDDGERLTVRLLWGGGLTGHWGIVVGPADMPIPPSDASKSAVQCLPLAPGAHIWSSK